MGAGVYAMFLAVYLLFERPVLWSIPIFWFETVAGLVFLFPGIEREKCEKCATWSRAFLVFDCTSGDHFGAESLRSSVFHRETVRAGWILLCATGYINISVLGLPRRYFGGGGDDGYAVRPRFPWGVFDGMD
jgi:hypothetical protein